MAAVPNFISILREEADKAANLAGRNACCLTGVSLSAVGSRVPVSLLLPNEKGQYVSVPKVQFVAPEALFFFIQAVAKRCDSSAIKSQLKQVLEANQASHKCLSESARAAAKGCDALVHWRMDENDHNEEFLEQRKQSLEQRKEAEKAKKVAEKEKEKEAKKVEKEKEAKKSSSDDEKTKRVPKRKRSDSDSGSPTPASSPAKPAEEEQQEKPKVKRVRKEKSAAKPREALGLAVDETIGSFQPALGGSWDSMAQ